MQAGLNHDYTAVGHVTVDVLAGGERRPGGSAFYSALQAARLGRRALILTQGVPDEIEELLAPFRGELDVRIVPAPATTTLATDGAGAQRRQRMLAWAGAMAEPPVLDTAILHLAPVARECPPGWRGRCAFVGLTPQGLAREWRANGGRVELAAAVDPAWARLARSCDAVVVSEHERASCGELIAAGLHAGATAVVTAGAAPATVLLPGGRALAVKMPAVARARDDLGAGDVFAAAFFIALAGREDPERAVAFAGAAAAVRLQGSGAEAIGDRRAICARLHALAGSSGG